MKNSYTVCMFIFFFVVLPLVTDCVFTSNRDVDETISWIKEKEQLMGSDDFGRDLASVQALLRKHEGLERDLAALEDKVGQMPISAMLANIVKGKLKTWYPDLLCSPSLNQVKTLGGDAEHLQQTHPQNASQIHLKKDELITNWEQIRTLSTERRARLNDSYQ